MSTDDRRDTDTLQSLRRRAYKELGHAIDEGRSELSYDWFAAADPALDALRAADEPEWRVLTKRLGGVGTVRETDRETTLRSPHVVLAPYAERRVDPRLPEPAWGDPRRRRNAWFIALVVCVALAVTTVAIVGILWVLLWTPAVGLLLWRLQRASRDSKEVGAAIRDRATARAEEAARAERASLPAPDREPQRYEETAEDLLQIGGQQAEAEDPELIRARILEAASTILAEHRQEEVSLAVTRRSPAREHDLMLHTFGPWEQLIEDPRPFERLVGDRPGAQMIPIRTKGEDLHLTALGRKPFSYADADFLEHVARAYAQAAPPAIGKPPSS